MRNIALTTLIVLCGVFGLQNIQEVPVTFLLWQTSTYLALALLAALALGVLIGVLLLLPWALRQRRKAREVVQAISIPTPAATERGSVKPGPGDDKAAARAADARPDFDD